MSASTHEILKALARPFPADAVSWRVGQVGKTREGDPPPTHARALAYIDARDCEDRLDEVMGVNWQSKHKIHLVSEKGEQSVLCVCRISLLLETPHGTMWIGRSNGSGETDYEGQKGAMSKAFVRAASAWGVGRFLYAIGSPRVKVQQLGKTWGIDKSEEPRLRAIVDRLLKEYETNPRVRPLVHEETGAPAIIEPAQPSSTTLSTLPTRLLAIREAPTCEAALVALSQARQDERVSAVAAEQIFYSYIVTKATQATKPKHFVTLDGALGRASIAGTLTKQAREVIARARREKA